MRFKLLDREMAYDGGQLRSLFNYLNHDLQGDSLLAFIGPCSVSLESMVDGEDKKAGATIASDKMLHLIIEVFHQDLFSAVCLQRLMADLAISTLRKMSPSPLKEKLTRAGDDIFAGEKKLSISIATSSPLSQLIHFALNVTTKGTPVPTLSLEDLQVEPKAFAMSLARAFQSEFEDIFVATTKVHWVK